MTTYDVLSLVANAIPVLGMIALAAAPMLASKANQ